MLDGMRLCECFDFFFFFQMNCKIFHGNDRQDTYDRACISQTPGGAGASVSKSGIYKHLSDEKVWRRVGGQGRVG